MTVLQSKLQREYSSLLYYHYHDAIESRDSMHDARRRRSAWSSLRHGVQL